MSAADKVRTWDALWTAFVHAKQTGDVALLADARRAIEAFDDEHKQTRLRATK